MHVRAPWYFGPQQSKADGLSHRGTKAYPERIAPGTLYLPPGEAVEASLRCWPPADLLQQQLERQGGTGDVEAAEVPGQLLVNFTCGTQQVRLHDVCSKHQYSVPYAALCAPCHCNSVRHILWHCRTC
jgi:hypothetical protein